MGSRKVKEAECKVRDMSQKLSPECLVTQTKKMVEKKVKRGKQVKEGGILLDLLLRGGASISEAPPCFPTLFTSEPRSRSWDLEPDRSTHTECMYTQHQGGQYIQISYQ